jgi:predicted 3-demethylubiquinone-9 3-methyltransferase (glyoxalase superfamily)
MAKLQKITPFFWFEKGAEDAANYYVSIFKNGQIKRIQHYPKAAQNASGMSAGSVMTVEFDIEGMTFSALNGGPIEGFTFSPATSFVVACETQEEIDHLWEKLSAVPQAEQCGWCKDKFGITWQIVPANLTKYLSDPDSERVERVTKAFMQMKKFNIAELERAYEGE